MESCILSLAPGPKRRMIRVLDWIAVGNREGVRRALTGCPKGNGGLEQGRS